LSTERRHQFEETFSEETNNRTSEERRLKIEDIKLKNFFNNENIKERKLQFEVRRVKSFYKIEGAVFI
jgi:hypothetical protein